MTFDPNGLRQHVIAGVHVCAAACMDNHWLELVS
jgi:hypothetical protein